ncbi:KedN5 family methylcobalamin-dependent radical SAM C-methyltransferase [Streptomyces collinus]|uniref:KedN5 family methylcobalamin-dependent radical SAM C-methyltransferase n=1 Tax=Streptomyces collinus TaxID=42684 RepID=UPI0037F5143C
MLNIKIVQQGVWHMPKESMPLAAGYLSATVNSDPQLAAECRTSIHNFSGHAVPLEMAVQLLRGGPPDIVGFSVLGWNMRQFGAVAETIKQANPQALVVFGGNHVANQAARVFRLYEAVDVVVNGEGEPCFRELLRAMLDGRGFAHIKGISFRGRDGEVVTTPDQPRIDDLDEIPSPILTGSIPLLDDVGEFRYDVALLETNRGCPYHCAFCYWGGAVGQRVRAFSRARLRQELERLAEVRAETVVLCDANFGMIPADLEFVEDLVDVKERTGYPLALETSWAKNKNATFYEIVRRMRDAGLQSSFTLALQTLDDETLQAMNRRNMKINQWQDLAAWLATEGLDCYAELIWGAPGETPESFLHGYDELARYVSRIAAYPLLLLPNTDYVERREEHGFVTVRGERDDFEYVLANKDVSLEENLGMQRFLFWARLLAENLILRNTWPVLRAVAGLGQSAAILSLADHIEGQRTPGAGLLADMVRTSTADPDSLAPALEFCFTEPEFDELVLGWWRDVLPTLVPTPWYEAVGEVLRFDLECRPLPNPERRGFLNAELVRSHEADCWQVVREYAYDVIDIVQQTRSAGKISKEKALPDARTVRMRFRHGFADLARSTNHEETMYYVACAEPMPASQVR